MFKNVFFNKKELKPKEYNINSTFDISKLIKEHRESMNISQTKFAEKTGMEASYINAIENKKRTNLNLKTLLKLLGGSLIIKK